MIYTDEDLARLISCPKRISRAPRKEMREHAQMLRDDLELESLDRKHMFRVFLRKSLRFDENFSVGMDYLSKDGLGSFCLLRYNGMHGGHSVHPHHRSCHIHRSRADDVNAGRRIERHIELTTQYASFRGALRYFLLEVNIQEVDLALHFPGIVQPELFEVE